MEVKVRLGPTQRTHLVALYPPPTLSKFSSDCIKLFKLPTDTPLNITYKTDRNQQIAVNTDGDFNDVGLVMPSLILLLEGLEGAR